MQLLPDFQDRNKSPNPFVYEDLPDYKNHIHNPEESLNPLNPSNPEPILP